MAENPPTGNGSGGSGDSNGSGTWLRIKRGSWFVRLYVSGGRATILISAVVAALITLSIGFSHDDGWGTPAATDLPIALGIGLTFWFAASLMLLGLRSWQTKLRAADSATTSSDSATTSSDSATANSDSATTSSGNATGPSYTAATSSDTSQTATPLYSFSLKRILIRWTIILVCWLPILISMFPGILFNDTIIQLAQYFGEPMYGYSSIQVGADFSDHHPVFTLWVYGTLVQTGWTLFGSANAGLFFLVGVQAAATALTFSFATNYLERIGAPRTVVRIVLLLFCFLPLLPWFSTIVVKDTFFSWLYVVFLIVVFEALRTKGAALRLRDATATARPKQKVEATSTGESKQKVKTATRPNPGWLMAFILSCLLLSLTKKTGLFLVVGTCLLLLVFQRRAIFAYLTGAVLPMVVVVGLLPTIVFPSLNISPGTPVEALGILYQQTARYVIDNPEDVTPEERESIDEMFDYDRITERYSPHTVDPLKGFGYLEGVEAWPTSEQIGRYLGTYVAQGFRHPNSYLAALGALEAPWFYPHTYAQAGVYYLSENWIEHAAWPPDTVPHYDRPEEWAPVTSAAVWLGNALGFVPGVFVLYAPMFYVLCVPALLCLLLIQGEKRYRPLLAVVAVSFLILLASPISGNGVEAMRYVMPFVYSAPLLGGLGITAFLERAS